MPKPRVWLRRRAGFCGVANGEMAFAMGEVRCRSHIGLTDFSGYPSDR
jgi:hypothetical protein